MQNSFYSTQIRCSFSTYTTIDLILCSHLTNFSLGFKLNLLNNARNMCQKIHKPVETQSSMRKLRRQFGPCMAASCHLRAIEGDGTGHLALPEGPCREPWEASISLAACGTYPLSTPARRSGPMPKIEHCTVLMLSDYRC